MVRKAGRLKIAWKIQPVRRKYCPRVKSMVATEYTVLECDVEKNNY